jgi:UDP-N-acetylmuramoyl-tripeptide--D-alanyl-D-alanine ligase
VSAPFSARDALAWTGGELVHGSPDAWLAGACIDTRTLGQGELFLAVVGTSHDAHRFLEQALLGGAGGLVVERGRALPKGLPAALPVLAVPETTRALGALAAGHRARFAGPLVAITGSNGKTSTKEMCAAILGQRAPCLKNAGNLNNQYGLPLTLLRRGPEHASVVVELGMNHRGEIAALTAIARPTVAVITNAGSAHIEHLGSRDEIAREKGDILLGLAPGGTAVLNADDPRVLAQGERTRERVLRFGQGPGAEVRALDLRRASAGLVFELESPAGRAPISLAGLGEGTLSNALAAAAAALCAGASLEDVAAGLARWRPLAGRLHPIELPGDRLVLDDAYNANPQSLENALRLLASLPQGGRSIAVLGDMGELGAAADPAHREAGRLAAGLGIDFLFAVGERAPLVAASAREAGMPAARVQACKSHTEAAQAVLALWRAGDRVLVKGSRSARMERVVEQLVAETRS